MGLCGDAVPTPRKLAGSDEDNEDRLPVLSERPGADALYRRVSAGNKEEKIKSHCIFYAAGCMQKGLISTFVRYQSFVF